MTFRQSDNRSTSILESTLDGTLRQARRDGYFPPLKARQSLRFSFYPFPAGSKRISLHTLCVRG